MTKKLVFDDRHALQLMLGSANDQKRVAQQLHETIGVALHVRGNEISLEGAEGRVALAAQLIGQMFEMAQQGRPVEAADVERALDILVHGKKQGRDVKLGAVYDDVVVNKKGDGKPIVPRSLAQKRYVELMRRCNLTFGVGPAGTGKTYLAVAMAVRRMLDKQVKRIILVRPAIEAGENLGFLPGTFEEKVSPYMRPLYDSLFDMLDAGKVSRMMEQGIIEVAPLAYMRGRTLNDAFVILDEAQNTSREQMKMFLTRIGVGTWAAVTGDPSQVDLPSGEPSGLAHALHVLGNIKEIGVCRFSAKDVMRHPLVQSIIRAYERDEAARAGRLTPPREERAIPESEPSEDG